jgi:hypothetical protein
MSKGHPSLPAMIVNRDFMAAVMSVGPPSFSLGLVEIEGRNRGFLALYPKHVGRPRTPAYFVDRIEMLARTTDLSVRQIHTRIEKVGRGVVGEIVKRARQEKKSC